MKIITGAFYSGKERNFSEASATKGPHVLNIKLNVHLIQTRHKYNWQADDLWPQITLILPMFITAYLLVQSDVRDFQNTQLPEESKHKVCIYWLMWSNACTWRCRGGGCDGGKQNLKGDYLWESISILICSDVFFLCQSSKAISSSTRSAVLPGLIP